MVRSHFRLQFSLRALLLMMLLTSAAVAWYSNLPITLNSSSLDTARYNHWSGTLTIRFQSGDRYQYFDVPKDTWQGLMKAESHGKYFYSHIRGGGFEFEKLEK